MPLQLQCTSVVIRNEALDKHLDGGAANFEAIAPNSMAYGDEKLSQVSFMSPIDAEEFCKRLELRGLERGPDNPDFVIVTQGDQSIEPPCDWLLLFEWENRLIGTLRGWDSRRVIAPKNGVDETIQHYSAQEIAERLEFVSRENNVDTYRNKETGELVYSARQTASDNEIFTEAFDTVWKLKREVGGPVQQGEAQQQIKQAIEKLQKIAAHNTDAPRVFLALGMAWFAIGKGENAIRALRKSVELDPEETVYHKEFAGVLLTEKQFEEALEISRRAVVVCPDSHELLGNLAVAELLNGNTQRAKVTIKKALEFEPADQINKMLRGLVDSVVAGDRPLPTSLEEMMRVPKKAKPKSFWARLFGK